MSEPREISVISHRIIIDAEMFPFLNLFKWNIRKDKKTYYAYTNFWIGKNHSISMHRLLTGCRNVSIDHKNRNGLDNRLENLRFATARENSLNRVRSNKFGFRGVYKPKASSNKFACQISTKTGRIHLYEFKTAEEAARKYDELSRKHHGEFGIRNFED